MGRVRVHIPVSVELDDQTIESVRALDRFAGKIARVRRALVDDPELSAAAQGAVKAIRTLFPKGKR